MLCLFTLLKSQCMVQVLGLFWLHQNTVTKIKLGRESFLAYTLTILFITKEIETYAGQEPADRS